MLKDNLARKISEKGDGFRRSVLSRQSGVKEATLYQILTGIIKNPGVYTVAKIADVLSCSVDELIGRGTYVSQDLTSDTELRLELFKNCVITLTDLLHQEKQKIGACQLLQAIKALYSYCLEKNLETVDAEFVKGFIEGGLHK